jgi:hypothetical protein
MYIKEELRHEVQKMLKFLFWKKMYMLIHKFFLYMKAYYDVLSYGSENKLFYLFILFYLLSNKHACMKAGLGGGIVLKQTSSLNISFLKPWTSRDPILAKLVDVSKIPLRCQL